MTAPGIGPDEVPDEVGAVLASDLLAIIGHLVAQSGTAGQPAAVAGAQLAALDRGRAVLAGFHRDALAWAAGPGPVPCWQSWANRLALALDELLAALDAQTASGADSEAGGPA